MHANLSKHEQHQLLHFAYVAVREFDASRLPFFARGRNRIRAESRMTGPPKNRAPGQSLFLDRRVRILPARLPWIEHARHERVVGSATVQLDYHRRLLSVVSKGLGVGPLSCIVNQQRPVSCRPHFCQSAKRPHFGPTGVSYAFPKADFHTAPEWRALADSGWSIIAPYEVGQSWCLFGK